MSMMLKAFEEHRAGRAILRITSSENGCSRTHSPVHDEATS